MARMMPFQAVEDWLRNLGLLHYAQAFYNNGYEDLETCRVIQTPDLDVIGIVNQRDREDILQAVKRLNQNVYFELEVEAVAKVDIDRSKIEVVILKSKLKDILQREHIQLAEPPYTNLDGSFGDLSSLSHRLADQLGTYPEDVVDALNQLRQRQLPVPLYNAMPVDEPSDFLDLETKGRLGRSWSLSKNDTRVTKSTTDLTRADLSVKASSVQQPKLKNKFKKGGDKQKSIFSWPKRNEKVSQSVRENRAQAVDYKACDVVLSQEEIIEIMHKVKKKELSQDDVMKQIHRQGKGAMPPVDNAGVSGSPPSSPDMKPKESERLLRGGSTKSSQHGRNHLGSSTFYSLEDEVDTSSSSSLQSLGQHSMDSVSIDRSTEHRRSVSLVDFDTEAKDISVTPPSVASVEKGSVFKSLRNSFKKRPKGASPQSDDASSKTSRQEGEVSFDSGLSASSSSDSVKNVDGEPVSSQRDIEEQAKHGATTAPPTLASAQGFSFHDNVSLRAEPHSAEKREKEPAVKTKSLPRLQEGRQPETPNRSSENMSLPLNKPTKQPALALNDIVKASSNLKKVKDDQPKSDQLKSDVVTNVSSVGEPLSTSSPVKKGAPKPPPRIENSPRPPPRKDKISGLNDQPDSSSADTKYNVSLSEKSSESSPASLLADSSKPISDGPLPTAPPRKKRSDPTGTDLAGSRLEEVSDRLDHSSALLSGSSLEPVEAVRSGDDGKTTSGKSDFITPVRPASGGAVDPGRVDFNPELRPVPMPKPNLPPRRSVENVAEKVGIAKYDLGRRDSKQGTLKSANAPSENVSVADSAVVGYIKHIPVSRPSSSAEAREGDPKEVFTKELIRSSQIVEQVSKDLNQSAPARSSLRTMAQPSENIFFMAPSASCDQQSNPKEIEVVETRNYDPPGSPEPVIKTKPLNELVLMKLRSESVDIEDDRYSMQDGQWSVSSALVRRYADELERNQEDIVRCIDSIRLEKRYALGKPVVSVDFDKLQQIPLRVDPTLDEWLVYIGLPMFMKPLRSADVRSIRQVGQLSEKHFKQIGVFDQDHVRQLLRAAQAYLKK